MKPASGTALRRLLHPIRRAPPQDLRGRRIIVTGVGRGSIGFATAHTLASWGADLVVTTRREPDAIAASLSSLLPAGAGRVDAQPLELSSAESVERFAQWYRRRYDDRLDALINNAGIHLDLLSQWQTPRLSADGCEIHWRTNYLGTFQLSQALLPALLATAAERGEARIVNIVSALHAKGRNAALFDAPARYDSWAAYGLSKLALIHLTHELQRRYGAQRLQAYCLHPGAVYTRIADKGLEGAGGWLKGLRRMLAPIEAWMLLNPDEGAQTSLLCATAPGLRGGAYYCNGRPATPSADAQDAGAAARLWDETMRWFADRRSPAPG